MFDIADACSMYGPYGPEIVLRSKGSDVDRGPASVHVHLAYIYVTLTQQQCAYQPRCK